MGEIRHFIQFKDKFNIGNWLKANPDRMSLMTVSELTALLNQELGTTATVKIIRNITHELGLTVKKDAVKCKMVELEMNIAYLASEIVILSEKLNIKPTEQVFKLAICGS
jgi:hypothetical protein